jgi:hypothetical protein
VTIDPKLFTVEGLLEVLFDDAYGGRDIWRKQAEIIVGYMPKFPSPNTRPTCVVKFPALPGTNYDSFLRHSKGPRQGHFWDIYGDDYLRPELALIALLEAPIPPFAIKSDVWSVHRKMSGQEP